MATSWDGFEGLNWRQGWDGRQITILKQGTGACVCVAIESANDPRHPTMCAWRSASQWYVYQSADKWQSHQLLWVQYTNEYA